MAWLTVLTVASAAHNTVAGDGSVYDSGAITGLTPFIKSLTELLICYVPTASSNGFSPRATVYLVDNNANLVPVANLDSMKQFCSLGIAAGIAFGDTMQVKVFSGQASLPCTFSLSIQGK